MAYDPRFGSDPAGSSTGLESKASGLAGEWQGESDLAELAAKFATHGGPQVSPELSADLALQVVLNEIVEQACLVTGASGAAIVLERGGEWVCRASAGANAPRLGARLDADSGLSGACVKTRTVQRCDDAQADPRADVEACRILGVRSVMILPLLENDELAGIFEVFSEWPSAFGERDEHTLEALSRRILKNLERASEPMCADVQPAKGEQAIVENPIPASTVTSNTAFGGNRDSLGPLPGATSAAVSGRGTNLMTLVLGAAVLAYAVLLTVLVAHRLGAGKARARAGAESHLAAASRSPASLAFGNKPESNASGAPSSATANAAPSSGAARATGSILPPGSLLVYDNGREVFRMPPTVGHEKAANAGSRSKDRAEGTEVQRASGVEPAGILKLPAEVAEGSLLHRVEPDYPEEARRQRIQGAVVLDVQIDPDGSVQQVTLVSGLPLLAQAATGAVKQWRFEPRSVNGRPAEMQTRITLNFRLPQ
jgi:TonB family protein